MVRQVPKVSSRPSVKLIFKTYEERKQICVDYLMRLLGCRVKIPRTANKYVGNFRKLKSQGHQLANDRISAKAQFSWLIEF